VFFNNTTIYIIECISWTMKYEYLILSMHGATMKNIKRCLLTVVEEASPDNLKLTASLSELVEGFIYIYTG
jgi:hypothetical protein